jgi:hypothetical protein
MTEPPRKDSLSLLKPDLKRKVEAILSDLRGHGLNPRVFETLRSAKRQTWMLVEGHSWVAHSRHQDGEACDIISADAGWGDPAFFKLLKSSALAHGLRDYKGGRSFQGDACHVQLP